MVRQHQVLVVDDSAFMRKLITDLIASDPDFTVIGAAKNGREAVDMTLRLKPDVITMDVEMPVMDGIQALQEIMSKCPTPVVILSSHTDEGDMLTFEALEKGAIDFVKKPSGTISVDLYKVKEVLLEKLHAALSARILPKRSEVPAVNRSSRSVGPEAPPETKGKPAKIFRHLVAIGTSTGGPKALQRILPTLPRNFPAPILIVQHMPPNFTRSLAQRLDAMSQIRVVEAEHEMKVEAGTAYIAPGDWHMVLHRRRSQYVIHLHQDALRNGHRPSVDVLFDSLAEYSELERHLVILTGMGGDGAHAMKRLYDSGVRSTIAESEETCVVFGMPKVAIELQAVRHILPLDEIPPKLMELVR